MLAKAKLASSITFIVLASFRIVTYDHQNMFIIQAAGSNVIKLFALKYWARLEWPDRDKNSILCDPFVSYEEKKMFY
jgi:hypothetical protein